MTDITSSELFDIAHKLVSFKSLTPDQAGCLDFIADYLIKLGFKVDYANRGATTNLIARYGVDSPIFAYAGHVDVVPVGDLSKWICDPFELTCLDGRLYGRGIADMKGSIAAFLLAVKQIISTNCVTGSVMILITSDEEGIAIDGTPAIVEYLQKNNIEIDYCIVGEPTSVDNLGDVIKIGRRGSLNGKIKVIGRQGHIAYPELCENPMHQFAPAFSELVGMCWDNGTKFFPPTSLQFSNLNSGLGVDNVIPENLMVRFNFRYNNLQTSESLQNKVEQILNKHNIKYEISWHNSAMPFMTKIGKLLAITNLAVSEVMNFVPIAKTDGGTSDGRFLIKVCKEIIELGLSNATIHQINENITDSELIQLCKCYREIMFYIFK